MILAVVKIIDRVENSNEARTFHHLYVGEALVFDCGDTSKHVVDKKTSLPSLRRSGTWLKCLLHVRPCGVG